MNRRNPLDWFAHEKIGEDAPSLSMNERYQIPETVDPKSLDPGERALAGILSSAASISSKIVPMIGSGIAEAVMKSTSSKWAGPPLQNLRSVEEGYRALERNITEPIVQKKKVLGLLDVEKTHPRFLDLSSDEMLSLDKQHRRLRDLSEVVDSFIHKNELADKGVRINFQRGPLSSTGGGSYRLDTKQLYLPNVSKEIALHELGHAADYNTRIGKIRGIAEPILEKGVLTALPVALAAGDQIKEMIPGTIDDKAITFMQDHAPGIMAATLAATTLYPEAKASFSAIRHIRDLERAGRQPAGAAVTAFKRLAPMFGSYLLGVVPGIVGMALARKYMNEARAEKDALRGQLPDIEKVAGTVSNIVKDVRDIVGVGRQLGRGTVDLVRQPGTIRRLGAAAKDIGTSPEFAYGALVSAVPATLGALYMYGTRGGEEMRSRLSQSARDTMLGHDGMGSSASDKWRESNPLRFAGLVGLGAALSGGVINRFVSDLTRVL